MSLTMILDDNKLSPKSELHRKSSKNFLPTLRIVTHVRGGKETRKNFPIKLGLDGLMSAIPSMMMAADEKLLGSPLQKRTRSARKKRTKYGTNLRSQK